MLVNVVIVYFNIDENRVKFFTLGGKGSLIGETNELSLVAVFENLTNIDLKLFLLPPQHKELIFSIFPEHNILMMAYNQH